MLHAKGPLLIAANHPNSFLDAVIIATLFKQPVYSLTRGDAFKVTFIKRMLKALHMLPVYRMSEGAENLQDNYITFEACKEIFKQNGIVLVFSEGLCVNEWQLRPLKKGTARLALQAWEAGIPLQVLPLGINYQSFNSFGKNIQLNLGTLFSQQDILQSSYGKKIAVVNEQLTHQLKKLVVEIDAADTEKIRQKFTIPVSTAKKMLLVIPALAGFLLHYPLYAVVKIFIAKQHFHPAHADSLKVCGLMIAYPFFLCAAAFVCWSIFGGWAAFIIVCLLPFCAWSYVQLKPQF